MPISYRRVWNRIGRSVRELFTSEVRWKARVLFGSLIALLLTLNGLNVLNSYVGRDFITALANQDANRFFWQAMFYIGVFAASAIVSASQTYFQERFALLWREWVTRRFMQTYLEQRTYVKIKDFEGVQNPDERISEDIKTLTTSAMAFTVQILNGVVTVCAFSGVLWSISPTLFGVCVGYAAMGSAAAFLLGRTLIPLDSRQLDREADFRSGLIDVREHAMEVALTGAEAPLSGRLSDRLGRLLRNYRRIVRVHFRLNLFTVGYNYLIQVIPALIVGPLFIRGEIEFGVVTQSAMAFSHLVGAFSLLVTQFQAVSSFAAVVARLGALGEAAETVRQPVTDGIQIAATPGQFGFDRVTLSTADGQRELVREFSAAIEPGQQLAITGENEEGRVALFLAAAGLWSKGTGRIVEPEGGVRFVPQRPHLIPGTLRDQFRVAAPDSISDDAKLLAALEAAGQGGLPVRLGGLDAEINWKSTLSLSEQQSVVLAGVLLAQPQFAVLDRLSTTVGVELAAAILKQLEERQIGCVAFEAVAETMAEGGAVVELQADGSWTSR